MSVHEVEGLHARYVALSHRFRAAWVQHQLVQSLRKMFPDVPGGQHAGDFQILYTALKDVSDGLHATEAERTEERLDQIESRLETLATRLVAEDSKIPTERLRQFFVRYQKHDEKILLQLARFYTHGCISAGWEPDRLDKLDFLLTRLAEEEPEGSRQFQIGDRRRLREVLASLAREAVDGEPVTEATVKRALDETEAVRDEVASVRDFDDLQERDLLGRYRSFKHGLGHLLLEPVVGVSVVGTNLAFKNLIRQLHRQEEQRIVAGYQQVFDLEGSVVPDGTLEQDLNDFRRDIESFEKSLQEEDLRLTDLARIRDRVRSLLPRLQAARPDADMLEAEPMQEEPAAAPEAVAERSSADYGHEGAPPAELRREYEEILEVLRGVPGSHSARRATLDPEAFPLKLEAREVTAFRRLSGGDGGSPDVERFLLEAAAARLRLARHVDELRELLDDSLQHWEAPEYQGSRHGLEMAGRYLSLFDHHVRNAVLEGDGEEARSLELLKVRLMRDYAGLWLLTYKPFLDREA